MSEWTVENNHYGHGDSILFLVLFKVDSSYLPIDVNVADPRNVEVMLYWIAMKAGVQ